MTTPKLQLPELVVGQAGKELTHNQALAVLDQLAQAVVVDKDLATPPGSPANGAMYIVAAGATGAWAGQSGKLAFWLTTVGAWTFATPVDGWSVWVADEAVRYERVGGAWGAPSGGANSAALDGLTGAADKLPYFTGVGALALADYTSVARTFDAATTVGLQRAALGLGTAAVATLATSTIDTTAGRAAITGYGGIGLAPGVDPTTHNWPATSLNDCTGACTGFWRTISSTTDRPVGFSTGCVVFLQMRQSVSGVTLNLTQTVTDNTSGATAVRSSSGVGTVAAPNWLPWRYSWDSSGTNAITVDTGSLGYGVGSGGTVTQATSKSTGVTLNKPSGQITMNNAALAAGATAFFNVNCTAFSSTDTVLVSVVNDANHTAQQYFGVGGTFGIRVTNHTAGSLSTAVILQFNIIKGATA